MKTHAIHGFGDQVCRDKRLPVPEELAHVPTGEWWSVQLDRVTCLRCMESIGGPFRAKLEAIRSGREVPKPTLRLVVDNDRGTP